LAYDSDLTPDKIREILIDTATEMIEEADGTGYLVPVLNLEEALKYISELVNTQ
jgi:hypothetical protein